MLGGLTMCELSVDNEGQQSEQDDGDRTLCDGWNDKIENWVEKEMMNGHKIENWVQHKMMDCHSSWNMSRDTTWYPRSWDTN